MSQSRKESCLEVFFNYLSGFLVGWAAYAFVVMPIPGFRDHPLYVVVFFTLLSMVRSFLWRRLFNSAGRSTVKQSKLESALEMFLNYLSGALIAYATYKLIVMPIPGLRDESFYVTSILTIISILRSFLWRRFFNARAHLAIHKLLQRTPA